MCDQLIIRPIIATIIYLITAKSDTKRPSKTHNRFEVEILKSCWKKFYQFYQNRRRRWFFIINMYLCDMYYLTLLWDDNSDLLISNDIKDYVYQYFEAALYIVFKYLSIFRLALLCGKPYKCIPFLRYK